MRRSCLSLNTWVHQYWISAGVWAYNWLVYIFLLLFRSAIDYTSDTRSRREPNPKKLQSAMATTRTYRWPLKCELTRFGCNGTDLTNCHVQSPFVRSLIVNFDMNLNVNLDCRPSSVLGKWYIDMWVSYQISVQEWVSMLRIKKCVKCNDLWDIRHFIQL